MEDITVGREGCEDGGEGGPDVGAESQRVHAVEVQDSDADKWSEGGCEDGTALYQHREAGADEYGHVAGEMTETSGKVGVDESTQHHGDLSTQQRVQELDNEDETETEES